MIQITRRGTCEKCKTEGVYVTSKVYTRSNGYISASMYLCEPCQKVQKKQDKEFREYKKKKEMERKTAHE